MLLKICYKQVHTIIYKLHVVMLRRLLAGAVDIKFPLLPLFDPTLIDSVYERDKCTDETCPFVTSVHVVDAAVLIVFGIQPLHVPVVRSILNDGKS
jgi:hypothetical protein